MFRSTHFRTFLCVVQAVILSSCAKTMNHETDINAVENNLLPPVIIAGEPGYQLEERMALHNVPGVSVTVFKDYEILWTRAYGYADAATQERVTPGTQFNVGSLSKGVAALTALNLAKHGKLDLNLNVNDQLTSWQLPENEFTEQAKVTPLLLMNHSSGAPSSPGYFYTPDQYPTLLQLLEGESPAKCKPVRIVHQPGTRFLYSNPGFTILQQLIIDVSGKPFAEAAMDAVFEPLGMTHSTFDQPMKEGDLELPAAGHEQDGSNLPVKRYVSPILSAGGLWSTTEDYARYIIEVQKASAGLSEKVITQDLAKAMLSPHAAKEYGLGVFLREQNGETHYFGHMGDNRGFFAGFAAHMTDGYGAVVFTNSQNGIHLIREIMKGVAQVYGWQNYLPEPVQPVSVTLELLNNFVGRYQLGSDASIQIDMQDEGLFLDRFGGVQLYHIGEGEFVTKNRMGSLKFDMKAPGGVTYHFADELGRFQREPIQARRMDSEELLPIELLMAGRLDEAMRLYRQLKQEAPNDPDLSEDRFNRLGYRLMGAGNLDQAVAILELNVELYPDSWNCYDSLGEAYMQRGDRDAAIANFKRSLELNPENQNSKQLLEELGVE